MSRQPGNRSFSISRRRIFLEWVTSIESGILLANVCEDWVPEKFWRGIYNIGGGESFRLNYIQYFDDMLKPFWLWIQGCI